MRGCLERPWPWPSGWEQLSVEEQETWSPKGSSGEGEAYIELVPCSGWNENISLGLKHPSWLDLDVILVMAPCKTKQPHRKSMCPRGLGRTKSKHWVTWATCCCTLVTATSWWCLLVRVLLDSNCYSVSLLLSFPPLSHLSLSSSFV